MPETIPEIPWATPVFWGDEHRYVSEALDSTWISGGPFVDRLEQVFSSLSGGARALAVSNGTAAIQLAYLALGVGAGDEIVVPGFGFLAAANVALNMAARPVFCEVDPQTWCVRAEDIAPCLTSRTRAIVVVHTYGNVCDMVPILALANEHGIPVIEDSAEAFPSRYRGQLAGSMGTIGTYSFQATKTITTGEGGMVVTRNDALYDRMVLHRSHGLRRKNQHYRHEVPGLNFRLTNMQAALGCAQMDKLNRIVAERRRVYATYLEHLAVMDGLTLQEFRPEVDPVVWAIAVRLNPVAFPQGRDAVLLQMLEVGIELRPGFYSPSQLEYFNCPPLATCDALAASIVSLPSYPTLTGSEIERICTQLANLRRS
jgi:perosamine synthetase